MDQVGMLLDNIEKNIVLNKLKSKYRAIAMMSISRYHTTELIPQHVFYRSRFCPDHIMNKNGGIFITSNISISRI